MRTSGFVTAAFAAVAVAVPMVEKRVIDIVTDTDIVYVTDIVTKTVGAGYSVPAAPVSSTSAVAAPVSSAHHAHYHHHHHSSVVVSSVAETTVTSVASSSAPPPPPPSTTETPTEAPVSTSVYTPPPPAPTTSEAPAPAPTSEAPSSSAVETSAAPASTALVNGGTSGGAAYKQAVVGHHNAHRSNHSAPAIQWDDNLASIAASIAATCVYAHNVTAGGGGYGQNIAAGVGENAISEVISNLFYDGEVNYFEGLYGQANPDMTNFEKWGHFSQIVWKGSTKVGCWTHDCGKGNLANVAGDVGAQFTVCNYSPPGNFGGQYGANIGQPLGKATVIGGGQ